MPQTAALQQGTAADGGPSPAIASLGIVNKSGIVHVNMGLDRSARCIAEAQHGLVSLRWQHGAKLVSQQHASSARQHPAHC